MSAALESTQYQNGTPSDEQNLQQQQKQLQEILTVINTNGIAKNERLQYMIGLRELITPLKQQEKHTPLYDVVIHSMLTIAKTLCDWSLIIFIQENLLPINTSKNLVEQSFDTLLLGEAYFQMGRFELSIEVLENQLLRDPQNDKLNQCRESVYQQLQQPLLVNQHEGADYDIYLTPLQEHHLESFSWQYSQSVMELCNLYDFTCDEEWLAWLYEMQQDTHRALFAVVHKEWGMIGCVSLQVYNGVGFFYYWLGEDFQAYGFGPKAVNLLLDYGFHTMGMKCCYAKIYEHNTPSHKAIQKLGFEVLPFSTLPPYDNEVFYYLGNERLNSVLFMELRCLLSYMDSVLEILPNECFSKKGVNVD